MAKKTTSGDSDESKKVRERISELERELTLLRLHGDSNLEHDRTLFENTGTATIIVETDTTIVLANAKFCELLELPRDEVEGKIKWPDYVHEDDRARMMGYHVARRQKGKAGREVPRNYSFRLVSATGRVRDIYLTIDVIPGTGRSIASLSDITELHLLQHALVESEERYRSLSEAALDMIITVDFDGIIKYANQAALDWMELDTEGAKQRSIFRYIHENDADMVRKLLKQEATKLFNNTRFEVRLVNGRVPLHTEVSVTVIRTPRGDQEVLTIIRDISPRRAAEEALRQSEERLRTVLQEMPVMLSARNEKDLICAWNNECERVTGWSEQEILGNEDVDDLLYPDPEYRTQIKKDLKTGGGDFRNLELQVRCRDGSTKVISWSSLAKYASVPGWASWGIGVDVTEFRHAEQKARDAEKLAVAQELAATVAHEFRQPLATLQLATDLEDLQGSDEEKRKKTTRLIRDAVSRIDTLVMRLLTITQVETTPYALSMNMLDLKRSSGESGREKAGE